MKISPRKPASISMTVLSDSNFMSEYSGDEPVVSEEVAGFLINSLQSLSTGSLRGLSINITSSEITPEEAKLYERAIKNYFRNEQIRAHRELRANTVTAVALFFTGAAIMISFIVSQGYPKVRILTELLNIAGWVFVWEAVHLHFIRRRGLRRQYEEYTAVVKAKISFYSP